MLACRYCVSKDPMKSETKMPYFRAPRTESGISNCQYNEFESVSIECVYVFV